MDRVIVFETNAMEDAYTEMIKAAESRAVDAVVLDSYPALVADDESDKDMDQQTMASGARVTGKFFRKVGQATRRSLVEQERPLLALIVNQFRDQIGGWAPAGATPRPPRAAKPRTTPTTPASRLAAPSGSTRSGPADRCASARSSSSRP